jgi:hypothetical protein
VLTERTVTRLPAETGISLLPSAGRESAAVAQKSILVEPERRMPSRA